MVQTVDYDTLATLAEMAVSIIGIAGLVAVFLSRGTISQFDKFRFLFIVIPAGTAAVGSYLPIWFGRHLADQVFVWQFSAGIIAATIVFGQLILVRSGYGFRSEFVRELRSILSPYVFWASTIVGLFVLILSGLNAASWPILSNQTIYEFVLMLMIAQATLQFVSMVYYRSADVK